MPSKQRGGARKGKGSYSEPLPFRHQHPIRAKLTQHVHQAVFNLVFNVPAFGILALVGVVLIAWSLSAEPLDVRLQRELQQRSDLLREQLRAFFLDNPNLKTFSEEHIGWIHESPAFAEIVSPNITEQFLSLFENPMVSMQDLLLKDAHKYVYAIVPGLFTRWYPLYMRAVIDSFAVLNLDLRIVPVHTDFSIVHNARIIREFVLRVSRETKSEVILIGHSKGAVDAADALSLHPEIIAHVKALVSEQAPYGGATLVHDLMNFNQPRQVSLKIIQALLSGDPQSLLDLTYDSREKFLSTNKYPFKLVPTVSLATCANSMPLSLLKPSVDYISLKYGVPSDGCVTQSDAIIPGSQVVYLNDMDHFGPAYHGFPALDRYDPARMILTLLRILLQPTSLVDM